MPAPVNEPREYPVRIKNGKATCPLCECTIKANVIEDRMEWGGNPCQHLRPFEFFRDAGTADDYAMFAL